MVLIYLIIGITCITSYLAFQNPNLMNKLLYHPYSVKKHGEYHRLITHGLVHNSWMHLGVNMYVLYAFGKTVELTFVSFYEIWGYYILLALYFGGMLFAAIPAWVKHKDNSLYRSVGASGAVSAILFAFILFYPFSMLQFIFVPFIDFPAIVFGIGYILYESYAQKNANDFIAHDAHIFGAIFGFLFPVIINYNFAVMFIGQILDFFSTF